MNSDIGVLPSYGETYGYSILEAMAHGCAVVVPRVSAFTECVSDDNGVLLEIPVVTDRGLVTMNFASSHEVLHRSLVESLVSALGGLENNPSDLRKKGEAALQRIKSRHWPQQAAKQLEQIYFSTFVSDS